MAVKSAVDDEPPLVGSGLASVNSATSPLKSGGENTGSGKMVGSSWVTVGCVRSVVVSGASAMMAEPMKVVVEPPSSVTVTV